MRLATLPDAEMDTDHMTTIYLLRHAQSQPDRDVPDSDWPLSVRGRQQALDLVPVLSRLEIEAIYSSPYRRALETVKPFARHSEIGIVVHESLREQETRLTGGEPDFRANIRQMWADFHSTPTSGEPAISCQTRVVAAISEIGGLCSDKTVLVSSHGNAIALFLNHLDAGIGYEEWRRIKNPDLFKIELSGRDFLWDRGWQP